VKRRLHGAHWIEETTKTEEEGESEMNIDDDFLMDIPEVPEEEVEQDFVDDEVDVAFKFAFVGVGQGGGRIAESFYNLGYRRVCAVNTNSQDLSGISIPESHKLIMDVGHGGAGKDLNKGKEAASQYKEDIYDLMTRSFGRQVDRIFVCVGAGGGTGSGGCDPVVNIAHEVAKSVKAEGEGKPPAVGVIVSMPKETEGGKVNANAHKVLDGLFSRVGNDKGKLSSRDISPLVVIDNDRIEKIFPKMPVAKFWSVANKNISSLLHLFNSIACRDSDYTTFDRADFKDVLDSGVVTFGACPIRKWGKSTDISEAIRANFKKNVLAGGFDLGMATSAACVFVSSEDVLNTVPQGHLEHGFEMLCRIMKKGATVHRGIYQGSKPGIVVYTILAELQRPTERMSDIARIGGME